MRSCQQDGLNETNLQTSYEKNFGSRKYRISNSGKKRQTKPAPKKMGEMAQHRLRKSSQLAKDFDYPAYPSNFSLYTPLVNYKLCVEIIIRESVCVSEY